MLDFGNGCALFISSVTATHSLVTDVLIFDPASSKNLMSYFNYDQRSFDKKSWLFLVHLLMKIFLFFNLLSKTCYLSVYKQIYFFEEITDYWLRRTLLIHSFFYKKLAIKKRGLRWKKIKKLQGWTRTDLRNCQIQKIQKCWVDKSNLSRL